MRASAGDAVFDLRSVLSFYAVLQIKARLVSWESLLCPEGTGERGSGCEEFLLIYFSNSKDGWYESSLKPRSQLCLCVSVGLVYDVTPVIRLAPGHLLRAIFTRRFGSTD